MGRQVYGPTRTVIVGGDGVRSLAAEAGAAVVRTAEDVVSGLAPGETHVWFVLEDAEPRPGALRALVGEAERVGASVAGSKLLATGDPERLLAVGVATDVFDDPYTGIDPDEVDAGQYDVVRDVAALSGASVLIRRDLALGLRGLDPAMAPGAATIDLCQRARLRGARVVIVPSSEVLYPAEALERESWREEAGRIRAMVKAYSWLTLAWALPLRFAIGLVDVVVAPFIGRWSAFRFVGSWGWNLLSLPSTLGARSSSRSGSVAGDGELFRYQLRGSAKMRTLGGSLGTRVRSRFEVDEGLDLAALGRELRQPGLIAGVALVLFVLAATRSLWDTGFPLAGFSMPLPASGWDTAGAYAGGWNPAGLGSSEPLMPFLGMAGLVQAVLFDRPDVAAASLVVASLALATIGFHGMMRAWGVDLVPAIAGSLVLIAGPATRALAGAGAIPTLVGLGFLPWAVRIAVAPWPSTRRRTMGRVAGVGLTYALVGNASPLLVLAAVGLVLLATFAGLARGWRPVAVALGGAVVAGLSVSPWLGGADLTAYVRAGEAFWAPAGALLAALGIAAAASLVAAPPALGGAAVWGSAAAAVAVWAARSYQLGAGREVELAALAAVAMGSAAVVAVVFEALRRVELVRGWDRVVVAVGAVGAVALVASAALVLLPGRAGLPGDRLGDALHFIDAAGGDAGAARVLLVGPEETLPGESRALRGASYRVVSAPEPTLVEAWLPGPGDGDAALAGALEDAVGGETFRVGEELAGFGVRWVIVTGETPLEAVLRSQLDLVPLEGLQRPTFLVESRDPIAAAKTRSGGVWDRTPWGYAGAAAAGERLVIAESADPGWGPGPWERVDWANEVSAETGEARFAPDGGRRLQGQAAGIAILALLLIAWWGRRGA